MPVFQSENVVLIHNIRPKNVIVFPKRVRFVKLRLIRTSANAPVFKMAER